MATRTWVQRTPVKRATAGESGGAARRLRARLLKEGWAVDEGWKPKAGFIYTQVRAISARINQNFDAWPSSELKRAYRTFLGKPCFVNHANNDPSRARGVVVAARYVEASPTDKYIEVVQEIDAQRFPKLAHEIKTGGLDSVSMGAEAGLTECSIPWCKNAAVDESDFCDHVRYHKGEFLTDPKTGEKHQVFENCFKISFFELSYVFEPADETAVASKVIVAGRDRSSEAADYTDRVLRAAGIKTAIGDCLADGSCDPAQQRLPGSGGPGTTGPSGGGGAGVYSPDSLGTTLPGLSGGSGGGDSSGEDTGGSILPATQSVQDWINKSHPEFSDIGGYRKPDGFNEHSSGHALDVMLPKGYDPSGANAFMSDVFKAHPNVNYILYNQRQWNPDGTSTPMGDRGNPTQNHKDHFHINVGTPKASPAATQRAAASFGDFERRVLRVAGVKHGWGELEAPERIDTLREEGTEAQDDSEDFRHYVDSPDELRAPDLARSRWLDEQRTQQQAGQPAAAVEPEVTPGYITLKVPIPGATGGSPQPMQSFARREVSAATLGYFENYFGRRIADWRDAIEANRAFTPEERADYRRAVIAATLEKTAATPSTSEHLQKGTADMARSTLAQRGKTASRGRRRHFAEGPLADGGDRSRNDQGEQEEAFISQTPPEETFVAPTDDTPDIDNTEHNLVARVQRGQAQLIRDARALAALRARSAGRRQAIDFGTNMFPANNPDTSGVSGKTGYRRYAELDEAGGPVATEVDPRVNSGPGAEEQTGDDFTSANPNDGVIETQPKDASLKVFRAFDNWLGRTTGRTSRHHNAATIRKAARVFARQANIPEQALFPALGVVLRHARKTEAARRAAAQNRQARKGAPMRKRADEKLEVAAPDARVDVEEPVADTTDAEAQASQFALEDFGNNAGDSIADPDLSTDQNWAPGEASKTSRRVRKADGILAMRCAEAMIDAGLEPNSRQRKYQLARQFETMSRGTILDRIALAERFAMIRQADRRKVASGSARGAARSPLPPGLTQSGARSAQPIRRTAANDPTNDSALFF